MVCPSSDRNVGLPGGRIVIFFAVTIGILTIPAIKKAEKGIVVGYVLESPG